jgi:hypothetical protein
LVQNLKQLAATGRSAYYRKFTRSEFSEKIADVEEIPGDRFLAMDGLSECSVPLEVYERRVNRLRAQLKGTPSLAHGTELRELLKVAWKNRQRREEALRRNLDQEHWVRDMTTIDAIVRLVTEGIFSRDDVLLYIGNKIDIDMRLTVQERIQILEHLVKRLKERETYELFFATLRNQPFSMIKRGDQGCWLLIESFPSRTARQDSEGEWDIEVCEPEIVSAFHQTRAWQTALQHSRADETTTKKHTHKQRCIKYLEGQIHLLRLSDKKESLTTAPLPDLEESQAG